jgi:exonuclease VII small subunit
VLYKRSHHKEVRLDKIIGNLDKAKLKLDEAFFYLDEIEELIQEDDLSDEAGSKVSQAAGRLVNELSALSGRVAELQDILAALESQEAQDTNQA